MHKECAFSLNRRKIARGKDSLVQNSKGESSRYIFFMYWKDLVLLQPLVKKGLVLNCKIIAVSTNRGIILYIGPFVRSFVVHMLDL